MKIKLQAILNDANIDANQKNSQRQLGISIAAISEALDQNIPLNLGLILDRSGSMSGKPLQTVKLAVEKLLDQLKPTDRISIVAFNEEAKVIVPNQLMQSPAQVKSQVKNLVAEGSTSIYAGLNQGLEELNKGTNQAISHAFLLTDGHGESGFKIFNWQIGNDDNRRCRELALRTAALTNITINTLGFGSDWNQDLLENIADAGGGSLCYIEHPEQAVTEFSRLFNRLQSVGLTNAYLLLSLSDNIRLAELKPIAQIRPDVIELPVEKLGNRWQIRVGDLMKDNPRILLGNIYIGALSEGKNTIAQVQIRYDDPGSNQEGLLSQIVPVEANVVRNYQPMQDAEVQQYILALAKYRQTQLAEIKLEQGDRAGAATMLQTAAKTALQMGDQSAATVLQSSATQLQSGKELSQSDRKKTRIVSKTVLSDDHR